MPTNYTKLIKRSISYLDQYIKDFPSDFEENPKKAKKFFYELMLKIKADESVNPYDLIIKKSGLFYFFTYNAKGWEENTLPFFDAFPLILVLSVNKDYILGLNWHYLPTKIKAIVLKHLMVEWEDEFINDQVLVPMAYKKLLQVLGPVKKRISFAIKRYNFDRINKPMRVQNMDMFNAISYVSPDLVGINIRNFIKEIVKEAYK